MIRPQGFELQDQVGPPELLKPGSQLPDYLAELALELHAIAPPSDSAAGAEWSNWHCTPAPVGGKPPERLRIGVTVGLGDGPQPMAMISGLGERHTTLPGTEGALGVAVGTLLRILGSVAAGAAEVSVYNGYLTRSFADFRLLSEVRSAASGRPLLKYVSTNELDHELEQLIKFQEALARGAINKAGTLENPWQILVMAGDMDLSSKGRSNLNRLVAAGTEWGAFLGVGVNGLQDSNWLQEGPPDKEHLKFTVDPPPPPKLIQAAVAEIVEQTKSSKVPTASEFHHLSRPGEEPSIAKGMEVEIGMNPDGSRATLVFDHQQNVHALGEGPPGSGKTNLLRNLVVALSSKYGPKVDIRILDGKRSGLTVFGPTDEDGTFWPGVSLLGTHITDPEDWVDVLAELEQEMVRRNDLMGDLGADTIGELQAIAAKRRLGEEFPAIFLIMDEARIPLVGPRRRDVQRILHKLAAEGRQPGIHLVMSTQDWGNIATDPEYSSLRNQFAIRLAMPHAPRLMDPVTNGDFTDHIPHHAVGINTQMGRLKSANRVVFVPDAGKDEDTGKDEMGILKAKAWAQKREGVMPPVVIDGRVVPPLTTDPNYLKLRPSRGKPADGFVGLSFQGAARFRFASTPGKNFAVLGSEGAHQVMSSLASSIAMQHDDDARFTVLCYEGRSMGEAEALAATLKRVGHNAAVVYGAKADEFLDRMSDSLGSDDSEKHYVFVYGADNVDAKSFQNIVNDGPAYGRHVIGSWTGLDRLRDSLGGPLRARSDAIEGYALLNVITKDVERVTSNLGRVWNAAERPGRVLFHDTRGGTRERVLRMYSVQL